MGMEDYTRYQQGIIRRYYDHKQQMAFQKLEEMVADLYLADTEKKKASLWKRIEKALVNLEAPPQLTAHILEKRSPEVLAKNLKDWWQALPREKPREGTEG